MLIIVRDIVKLKNFFRALTKDDILKPYIFDNDCRSTNDGDNIG